MKKFFSMLLVLVLALSLVACGGGNPEPAPAPAPSDGGNDTPAPAEEDPLRVCLVVASLGDNSFSDSCDTGLKEAQRDFGIVYDCQQVGDDGLVNGIREAAQNGYDIVVAGYDSDRRALLDAESMDYPDPIFFL